MLSFQLNEKKALITGGSRGIGRAVTLMLAQAGAEVCFTYQKNKKAAGDVIKELGGQKKGLFYQCELTSARSIQKLFKKIDKKWPAGLDIFVANAGIWPPEDIPISEMTEKHWRQTISINLDSIFLMTKEVGKRIRDNGRIIYVGSTAGQRGEAFHVDYAASKGALISMVKGLCVEFGRRNITVNCVAPGWVDTDMAAPIYESGMRESIERGIPLGRVATAEDIAGPIVFLCSEMGRHITGEVMNVNGGAVLCG